MYVILYFYVHGLDALTAIQFLDEFIYQTGRDETDIAKRAKIDALVLRPEEWKRVDLLIEILAVCILREHFMSRCPNALQNADDAQQAFSYEDTPVLHTAIPALEALHSVWSHYAEQEQYEPFEPALVAGLAKIEDYYEKTSTSHVYTFVMRTCYQFYLKLSRDYTSYSA